MPRPDAESSPRDFATTQWTRVLLAGQPGNKDAEGALANLCEAYWYPLYACIRRSGYSPEDSQDLVQEFFARLLQLGWIGQADRRKGRFRSFLLASLKHFLANEYDKAQAQKRGGGRVILSIDDHSAETRYRLEPAHTDSPDRLFERKWAMLLLDRAISRLRAEYESQGKQAVFEELKNCLAGSRESLPYATIAARLGLTEGSVKVIVHRFRQRYREVLRETVAETVANSGEVEEEIRHLLEVLRD